MDNFSALYSPYIIDGIMQDDTPGSILQECMTEKPEDMPPMPSRPAVTDETIDLPPASFRSGNYDIENCLSLIRKDDTDRTAVCRFYPGVSTKLNIAATVIDTLWRAGHFTLGDLNIKAKWEWASAPVGNMAAFFYSAKAAGEYMYDLGVNLEDFTFEESPDSCRTVFTVTGVTGKGGEYDDLTETGNESLFESRHPSMEEGLKCGNAMVAENGSWLIYIPFDTCRFRLGGSLLSKVTGQEGGYPSDITDPDYFIDCYELIRELVEDGVVISGTTVGRGGLMGAADRFCRDGGFSLDISGISAAYKENDRIRILFGEVPGAIIQIRDTDYDYIDAQFLLQDVAYYPLGHPSGPSKGINLIKDPKSGIAGILESLINSQTSEGED